MNSVTSTNSLKDYQVLRKKNFKRMKLLLLMKNLKPKVYEELIVSERKNMDKKWIIKNVKSLTINKNKQFV